MRQSAVCLLTLFSMSACTPTGRDLSGLLDAGTTPAADAGTSPVPDGGANSDAGQTEPPDAAVDGGTTMTELVDPTHSRELRGVWIATVSNINFPSRPGLSVAAQQAELQAIVDKSKEAGLNSILFQVRPESDALYASTLEPWSRFLTGTQGQDPGYDPLSTLIDQAHAAGIEVHAWLNPYRAKSSASSTAVAPHLSVTQSEHALSYGNFIWMDPGAATVQEALRSVVEDLVTRYDLDGVHFDDYFYPYPDGNEFPDDASWAVYQAGGGMLDRGDWRRDNVNRMVQSIYETVVASRPHVRFGISPFGIYRPGIPEGINGLDQYAAIYSDPPRWLDGGWVDYLAPQLYWPSTQSAQAYGKLVEWWATLARDGRVIVPGNFLSKLSDSASWSIDEFRTQVALTRAEAPNTAGNIYFTLAPLQENRDGIMDVFKNELYPRPALPPVVPGRAGPPPETPTLSKTAAGLHIEDAGGLALRGHVVYVEVAGAWVVQTILSASIEAVDLAPGRYAITSVDRFSQESRGVAIDLP